MNKNILVTGKNGQLGCSIKKILKETSQIFKINPNNFVFVSRDEIDFTNRNSISKYFLDKNFSVIICFPAKPCFR